MNGLRGIATGILIATIILGLTFLVGGYGKQAQNKDDFTEKRTITDEEVQAYAKEKKLVILSQEEYDGLIKKPNEQDKKDTSQAEAEKPAEEKVIEVTLVIKSGMSTEEVANYLRDAKIIKNPKDLIDYLEKNKLAGDVKAGDHKVTSKMTIAEVANAITSY